jgi:aryl-alcohol dehydrogenase-like predicted oxidoreductase
MIECIEVAGSSVRISRIGFACARICAGCEVVRSSHRGRSFALSAGIRHYETAPMYGRSETCSARC